VVGTFSTTAPDPGDTPTYSLVSGPGDTGNGFFAISGNQLRATASLNFETKRSHSIRVRSTDPGGLFVEKVFTITVVDVNEAPTGVALANTVPNLPETTSTAARIRLANVIIADDALGANTITLVGADAAFFEVAASATDRLGATLYLKAATLLDSKTKPTYSVTVRVGDPKATGTATDATATLRLTIEPPPPTPIESAGSVVLAYDSAGNLRANGTPITVNGRPLRHVTSPGATWRYVAADVDGGRNTVVLQHSTGALYFWRMDAAWRQVAGEGLTPVGTAGFRAAEIAFGVDFDGNGRIGS